MLQKDYDNEAQFVPLVEATEYRTSSYTHVLVKRHKKKACSGCCMFILLATFLFLFFMLPRSPAIHYKSSQISGSESGGYGLKQTFGFENSNYYKMEWSDLELSVYLCAVSGSLIIPLLSCDADSVGSATYQDGGSFHTDARQEVNVELDYKLNLTPTQLAEVASLCLTSQVVFRTLGNVKAELSNGHDFPDQQVSQVAWVTC